MATTSSSMVEPPWRNSPKRLWDLNRNIGQPHQITTIFGRRVTKLYQGQLQTVIEDLDLPHPVIHSRYGHGFAKPYVRDDRRLRTEPATNRVYDYGVNQGIEKLPRLRERMSEIIDQYDTSNRTSWKPSLTVGHCGNWPNRRSCPAASGFPACSSITRVHWQGCMRWCASPLWLPAGGLLRRISMLRL
jgi:hypothetical protein